MYDCVDVTEAHRALELLEDYHSKLVKPQDRQLRLAIERVIRIFKSRLFQALLGKSSYFLAFIWDTRSHKFTRFNKIPVLLILRHVCTT